MVATVGKTPKDETHMAKQNASAQKLDDSKEASGENPVKGELVKRGGGNGSSADLAKLVTEMGLTAADAEGLETISTGGISKWINMKAFQDDPLAGQNAVVKGNGRSFAGFLIGRHEIEDEKGEENAEGVKVRHFYTIRLTAECPVEYKDENGMKVEETAYAGEVVQIGERHQLKPLRNLADDGGLYWVLITPHSRVRIPGNQTMWTFGVQKKTFRPAARMIVRQERAPY